MELARIIDLTVLPNARWFLRFADGAAGLIELAPIVARGGVFSTLTTNGPAVILNGRAISWRDPDGDEADMDADTLRRMITPARAAAE